MTDKRRKQRIAELREMGRQAYKEGRHTPPSDINGGPDAMHWYDGHHDAAEEVRNAIASDIRQSQEATGDLVRLMLITAIKEYVDGPTEFAFKQIDARLKDWEDHIINRTKQEIENGN